MHNINMLYFWMRVRKTLRFRATISYHTVLCLTIQTLLLINFAATSISQSYYKHMKDINVAF